MRFDGLRPLIIVSTLAAIGFAVAFLYSRSGHTEKSAATSIPSMQMPSTASAHAEVVGSHVLTPNLAAQKAGPPDPVAQKTAARSAESAARAAAVLAAK